MLTPQSLREGQKVLKTEETWSDPILENSPCGEIESINSTTVATALGIVTATYLTSTRTEKLSDFDLGHTVTRHQNQHVDSGLIDSTASKGDIGLQATAACGSKGTWGGRGLESSRFASVDWESSGRKQTRGPKSWIKKLGDTWLVFLSVLWPEALENTTE